MSSPLLAVGLGLILAVAAPAGWAVSDARGQGAPRAAGLAPGEPLPPLPAARPDPGVRRAQDQPGGGTSIPGGIPGRPGEVPAPVSEPGATEPTPNPTDLGIPRAERAGGGGEPTVETAREEEAAAPADARGWLMRALKMPPRSPVKLYGWVENSFTGNTNGTPRNALNFGVNPNFLANRWMGNQYYLIVENPLEVNDTVNLGFRVDNLFGNDWQFNHMHGLFDTSFTPNHFAGYDPAQVYGEIHLPILTRYGLDIKGGRWYTLAGYEVVPAVGRPLLSVPYMFNYGQPFTHLGAVSTLHVTDKLNVYNGTINGWDRWFNETYKWGYIGGFSWKFNRDRTTLAVTFIWGPNQFPRFLPANTEIVPTGATPTPFLAGRRNLGYGGNDRTLFTTVLTHNWTGKLTQVLETDQGFEDNIPGIGPGGTAQDAAWYSFGNWFLYAFSEKLLGVWRSEVFRDNNGVRTGFADNFYEITLGAQVKPKPWLWIRPEARYDWAQFTKPYNDGTRGSQFTLAVDAIILF